LLEGIVKSASSSVVDSIFPLSTSMLTKFMHYIELTSSILGLMCCYFNFGLYLLTH